MHPSSPPVTAQLLHSDAVTVPFSGRMWALIWGLGLNSKKLATDVCAFRSQVPLIFLLLNFWRLQETFVGGPQDVLASENIQKASRHLMAMMLIVTAAGPKWMKPRTHWETLGICGKL